MIFKNTNEGTILASLIAAGAGESQLDDAVCEAFLRRIPVSSMVSAIKSMLKKSFEEGRKDKVREIQNVLDL